MKQILVAVHDRAVDAYDRPWSAPTSGAAIRAYRDEVNRPESPMHKHADDYALYKIGEYDTRTGEITPTTPAEQLALAKNLIEQE